ncbi:rhomboid family intramembrane serine protease [Jeongeupia naejangsanensis]|uniref:Rhomboid family intramembrane serine protease n=1 Tax=Jeongeupia naejangsanensis TaxID=613195 RepID=A0ABS2BGT7_9NEIS|nr:rhomboid family intramembrane serine protease [Jeongeupia naejangsanensis]MBM3114823.1 rhomboid family intramembrane serine protease [Jeongeupia naejangsanensis]
MLILPLPAQPDWRRPPWVTLLLIVACCLIYFGGQYHDDARRARAFAHYQEAGLAEIELPRYLADLERRGEDKLLAELRADHDGNSPLALMALQGDPDFLQRLGADQVISPAMPEYTGWRAGRAEFDRLYRQVFTDRFALRPAAPTPLTTFMHMFMHGSVDHLLGNMAILFIVGYTVEAALGGGVFLLFYLIAGLGAAIPDLIAGAPRYSVSLGASGAIAGVMAMFVVLYGMRKIRFFYWIVVYFSTLKAPALIVLPVWLLTELWMRLSSPESHVNYMAHFAGLLTGAMLAAAYRFRRKGRSAARIESADVATQDADQVREAERWAADLQFDKAAAMYAKLTVRRPDDVALASAFYRAAKLQADPVLRQQAGLRVLELAPTAPALRAMASEAWQAALAQCSTLPKLSVSQWLKLAAGWLDDGDADSADRLLRMLVQRMPDQPALPALLFRAAKLFRQKGDIGRADACRRLLVQHYPDAAEARL